ncbi:MAG TPA: DedA family protein [Terriglobia bacterium]|nr:DedA family protein [Terriglobia bacterium]
MKTPVADTIFQTLSEFFARYGYWVIFFGVMLENGGIPVPGETVLLFAGFLAHEGKINLERAILTAIAGASLGDTLGYCLGHYGGKAFVEWLRRRLGFFGRHFQKAQTYYLKHGQWAVFVARFITGLRMFSGLFAGSFSMPYLRFLAFDFSGAVIWATSITCVGFLFGNNWPRLVQLVKEFDWIALSLVGLGGVVAVTAYYLRKRRENAKS